MSNEESLEDRQNNELEALKAIYCDDLKDLRNSAWKAWSPLDLRITLTPQQGNSGLKEIYAKLDFHVICTNEYPNKIPKIILENTRGLSKTVLTQLQSNLENKAKELKGEVMIFELAQYIQVFLHDHNKPGTKSFYEEMLIRKQQMEKEEQIKRNKAKQVIVTEVAQRQEILMQENKRRRESKIGSDNSSSDDATRRSLTNRSNSGSYAEGEDEINCGHKGVEAIQFDNNGIMNIQRGKCLGHTYHNSVIYSGLDTDTGDIVLITEWITQNKNIGDITQLQRQIFSIEQEMNYLVKLKHLNLVPYLNIKHEYKELEDTFLVYILQEFVYGCNCMSLFMYENICVDIDMLQHIASGVLSALDFLHRNNVVHKEISHSCIFLNNRGIVKLSNYSLCKRLKDLILPKHLSNYGKKQDIFKFGILILSLIKGKEINEDTFEIPVNIPSDLYDFLNRCLVKNEKDRFTTIQLLNHPFLKAPLDRHSPKRTIEENMLSRNNSPENPAIDFKMFNSNSTNQSRVQTEFQVLDCLGKGAYGEVFKVKNKLDQGYYAIKRIELNPKNRQLNKKIIREVKLLSKLNHENVVRYYNSWIECSSVDVSETDNSNTSSSVTPLTPNIPKIIQKKELTFNDDIELLAPPIQEWSISYDSKSKGGGAKDIVSSDEDSSDDDDNWGLMVTIESDDSDSIEFVGDEVDSDTLSKKNEKSLSNNKNVDTVDSVQKCNVQIQFMYIQMEFCEKSTLRTAIDNGLYRDTDRMWRLFREIVEGLAHIHQQGMIHRDLKPVNIFLDSNDHVKIGDFGLATTNFLSRINEPLTTEPSHECIGDGSMTGHVGTALYVAPELCSSGRVVYNQKVDTYSLGIILFEMCYKPLTTSMERIKILTGLRTKEIIFPKDFRETHNDKKEIVIRWLLNHNVSERPTSLQVLQSQYIPPPVVEEFELQELVRHTLSNPHLKAYKYLVESCFKQSISPAQDITYDKDPSIPFNYKNVQIYDYVKMIIKEIFELHGGQNLPTPLLMPNNKYYENVDTSTKLMTHSGSIVTIPHDLRVPFARYVAWNGISSFRRYAIERVYREKRVFGFLPRELYECAFDIVTPSSGDFMADGELLFMFNKIVEKIPGLKNKNVLIRLNHTSLITAILVYCGIKDKHHEVCAILSRFKEGKVTKFELRNYLINLGLSDNSIDTFITILELETPISKIMSTLQIITKKKSETSQLAKTALQDLRLIIQNAELLGVELPILVAPGLLYNVQQYSGMMCQLICEVKKKNKQGIMNVIAAGGRYDGMISSYRNIMEQADMLGKDIKQSAVGISLSLDKIVQIIQKDNVLETNLTFLDAVVCSVGTKTSKERTKILKDLWDLGVRCSYIEAGSDEEIQELCSEMHVPHFIMLNDSEQGVIRIRSWDNERFHEQKMNTNDLINHMKHKLKSMTDVSDQNGVILLNRSESKSSYNEKCEHNHENSTINVLFITEDEKLSANSRKRYENQIRSQLDDFLKRLNGDIVILAVNIEGNIIRKTASYLEFDSENLFNKSVTAVLERHQRHKKYLSEICDEIYDLKTKRSLPIVILYSLIDSVYRIM